MGREFNSCTCPHKEIQWEWVSASSRCMRLESICIMDITDALTIIISFWRWAMLPWRSAICWWAACW